MSNYKPEILAVFFFLLTVVTENLMWELQHVSCRALARYLLDTLCLHSQYTPMRVIHLEEQTRW